MTIVMVAAIICIEALAKVLIRRVSLVHVLHSEHSLPMPLFLRLN